MMKAPDFATLYSIMQNKTTDSSVRKILATEETTEKIIKVIRLSNKKS